MSEITTCPYCKHGLFEPQDIYIVAARLYSLSLQYAKLTQRSTQAGMSETIERRAVPVKKP